MKSSDDRSTLCIIQYVTYDQFCMFMFFCLRSFFSSGHWCGCRIECILDLHLTAAAAAVETQEEQRCGAVINMINMTEQQQLEDKVSE